MRFFEGYPVAKSLEQFVGEKHTVWSGFFGLAAGPQLSDPIAATWSEGREWFVQHNRTTDLAPSDYSPYDALPSDPFLDKAELEYEYQADMSTRQPCFIAPVVAPPEHDYQFPLLNRHWLEFILNAPEQYRIGASLYHDILLDAYPELFSLPSDDAHGQPLTSSVIRKGTARLYQAIRYRIIDKFSGGAFHPTNKFRNFPKLLRQDTPFRDAVYTLVTDLDNRGTVDWVNIPALWDRHQQGQDNSMELRMLANVELALRNDITGCSHEL
jgi:hypothetical protein